jgi:sugar phosphate isomerase/epimerase
VRFAICNEIFQGWKIDDVFAHCARLGYGAVEVAPFTLAPHVTDVPASERARIRAAAARAGIAISGIHWVLVQTEGMHLTARDAAARARTARYFVDLVDFCADLGGESIIVGSPKQRSLAEGVTHDEGWSWMEETFRPSISRAEERGVTICLEPLPAEDTNFINTAEEAVRFAREQRSPRFRVILDVRAMSHEARPVPDIIRACRGEFAYVHANDRNLKGPGFGEVDFRPIAAALRETGYDGTVSVEVFKFDEGPEVIASRSLEHLRKTFS